MVNEINIQDLRKAEKEKTLFFHLTSILGNRNITCLERFLYMAHDAKYWMRIISIIYRYRVGTMIISLYRWKGDVLESWVN